MEIYGCKKLCDTNICTHTQVKKNSLILVYATETEIIV